MQSERTNHIKEMIKTGGFRTLSMPAEAKYIIFSDFDETYFPHFQTGEWKDSIRKLEEYIAEKSEKNGLIFGLVTGSRLSWVFEKMAKEGYRILPHFIASAFGTQIHYFSHSSTGKIDEEWSRHIESQGYSFEKIKTILGLLEERNIRLKRQKLVEITKYTHSYFYYMQNSETDRKNIQYIKELADSFGIIVNISRCNPLIGDPENAYDVDFISVGAGKDEIVRFLLNKFKIDKHNSFAFGDSGNDSKMLNTVGNGYLLENATNEAKKKFHRIAKGLYAEGIYHTMKEWI